MGKFPSTEQSSLIVPHQVNKARHALRQRAETSGYDIGWDGLCEECDARFTETDIELGACTQCGQPVPILEPADSQSDAQKE